MKENKEEKYYDPKYITTFLEEVLGFDMESVKTMVNNSRVKVNEEEIRDFLDKKFGEENPELKKRIESRRTTNRSGMKSTEEATQEFADDLESSRYSFDPYTLKYFKTYSGIIRDKSNALLGLIERIGNGHAGDIMDELDELDINFNEDGRISKTDIMRLVTPAVHNIRTLDDKVRQANDLSTYLTFKMSLDSIYKNGWSENEVYPSPELQLRNLEYASLPGYVPLTDRQREEIERESQSYLKRFTKDFLDFIR